VVERDKERERERGEGLCDYEQVVDELERCVCLCLCVVCEELTVCERERERERGARVRRDVGVAYCTWSVIKSQSPISILLVSFQWNVAKET